ncbi:MAG: DNA-3-methyladenine glycosylase I [Acidimicrobiia bacterium]
MTDGRRRCSWAGDDPLMIAYHDEEWGVPHRDDRGLFELLTLEGAQAGLSWMTILRKRDGYRRAFAEFDAERVARFTDTDVERLLADSSIVRNRAKVESTIANAAAVLVTQREIGSLAEHVWSFVDGKPVQNRWSTMPDIPAQTDLSKTMSRDLKSRGFRFVGPTTIYSFMQAAGLVNDHTRDCSRGRELSSAAR